MTRSLEFVCIPPRQPSKAKSPVLVLLHGVGGNEQNLLDYCNQFDDRFQIISLRAPITLRPNSFAWFEVQFTPEPVINPGQAQASRTRLIEFLERIVIELNLEPSRVFLLGFSQGAIIGASVALTRPDLVAGLVMMSGRILPEIKDLIASSTALEQLPVLVTHGLEDSKLPIHHARASREKLVQLGVKLTYTEYDMAHEMIAPEIQEISTWLTARLND